jgi:signal transduction histidine kinase
MALAVLEAYFLYSDLTGTSSGGPGPVLRFLYPDLSLLPVLAFSAVFSLVCRARRSAEVTVFHRWVVRAFALLIAFWCAAVAAAEQHVSGEITTFIIGVLAESVLLYAGGIFFAVLLLSSLAVLVATAAAFGMAPGRLFSENPALVGMLLIGWLISRLLLWAHRRQTVARFGLMEARRKLLRVNHKLRGVNRQLEEAQLQLIRQEKLASIGQLSAGVAHEICNPIGFLKSNFSALEQHFRALRPALETAAPVHLAAGRPLDVDAVLRDIEELFRDSGQGFEQVMRVVHNLLDFSRVPSAGGFEKYDLHAGIESTLVVARSEYRDVAEIIREYGEIPLIDGMGGEINQVILNILTNAVHAIRSTGPRPRGTIRIRTWHEGGRVCCSLSNDGVPIPPEIVARIFDPFFTTKPAGQGTGLGLSIAYDIIVKRHRGELTVTSGAVTTFTFTLPVSQSR